MPLKQGTGKTSIEYNTRKLIHEGYPSKQAYAIAMREARKARAKKRALKPKPNRKSK